MSRRIAYFIERQDEDENVEDETVEEETAVEGETAEQGECLARLCLSKKRYANDACFREILIANKTKLSCFHSRRRSRSRV